MIVKLMVLFQGRAEEEVLPKPEWKGLKPVEAGRAFIKEYVSKTLAENPSWKADGIVPMIVEETRNGRNVMHPLIFDLAKALAN